MRTLVAYASRHGSTEEVAVSLAEQLHAAGQRVGLLPAGRVESLRGYDAIVLGGALYTGRWHRDAQRLLKRVRRDLETRPLAVFALGPRTTEPADVAASRAQLDAELARLNVLPDLVAVFGGVVDPRKLRFPFNRMQASDARDWDAVTAWADEVARTFGAGGPEHLVVSALQPEPEPPPAEADERRVAARQRV